MAARARGACAAGGAPGAPFVWAPVAGRAPEKQPPPFCACLCFPPPPLPSPRRPGRPAPSAGQARRSQGFGPGLGSHRGPRSRAARSERGGKKQQNGKGGERAFGAAPRREEESQRQAQARHRHGELTALQAVHRRPQRADHGGRAAGALRGLRHADRLRGGAQPADQALPLLRLRHVLGGGGGGRRHGRLSSRRGRELGGAEARRVPGGLGQTRRPREGEEALRGRPEGGRGRRGPGAALQPVRPGGEGRDHRRQAERQEARLRLRLLPEPRRGRQSGRGEVPPDPGPPRGGEEGRAQGGHPGGRGRLRAALAGRPGRRTGSGRRRIR